ncbi:MAG: hypothetical protein ABIA75_05925 [Candidatus Neomarinimicrobiota bacterium]
MAATGAGSYSEEEEIYLSFRYPGGVNTVVIAYMKGDQFFLPVMELFELLSIDYSLNPQKMTISGFYINPQRIYRIAFNEYLAQFENNKIVITASDYLVQNVDFYLRPNVFRVLFGWEVDVDLNRLVLTIKTRDILPVVEKSRRQEKYSQGALVSADQMKNYPMIGNRDRDWINGGFLDYTFYGFFSGQGYITSANLSGGGEIMFGDLQGTVSAVQSKHYSLLNTSDVRWRYVFNKNPLVTSTSLGQVNSTGLLHRSFTGMNITNEPVEPKFSFDDYVIDGTTIPESDVELYQNNRLVDYGKADEQGYYRFVIPLNYGTSDIKLRIYGPTGGIIETDRRVQVPFTFLPPGEINYNIAAGRSQSQDLIWEQREIVAQSNLTFGVTNWMTNKIGADYLRSENNDRPVFYNSLSARIATQYLFNLDLVPDAYTKLSTRVLYPNSGSWNLDFTKFSGQGLLNLSNIDNSATVNLYLPVTVLNIPSTVRLNFDNQTYDDFSRIGYGFDFSSFVRRLRLRTRYRDNFRTDYPEDVGQNAELSLSAMYTIPQSPYVNKYLRGMYFRSEARYGFDRSKIDRYELQILKQIRRSGRFQFTYSRDFEHRYDSFEIGINFDFETNRASSKFRSVDKIPSFTQTVRGSLAWDSYYHEFVPDNRQQVGRSGISVRMFVDENNSGAYDTGERVIPGNAVRLLNASSRQVTRSDVSRLTQLMAYRKYDFIVNEALIRDPLLVPEYKGFSALTDPNRYKHIDVPFYITGVIGGQVVRRGTTGPEPVGGLRLHLIGIDNDLDKTLNTFSDGSFYSMEIPPGQYEISVDITQLDFLGVRSNPEKQFFEVKALAEGDFIDNLNFVLSGKTTTR